MSDTMRDMKQGELILVDTTQVVSARSEEKASKARPEPAWSDVKANLADFDRAGLIALIKDLHSLSRDNRVFLDARLGLGADPLMPYKKTISRWISPDVVRGQDISVAKAKKAISDYRKAIGLPEGVAELSVHYCEAAASLLSYCGMDDVGYCSALVRMYAQALDLATALPEAEREVMLDRLDAVRAAMTNVGWGVEEEMNELWTEHVLSQ